MAKYFQQQVYRTLWRWHFYAGIFVLPFIVLLSVSGAVFLFKPQYIEWQESALHRQVVPAEKRYDGNTIIDAAVAAVPKSVFKSFRLPESDSQAVAVRVQVDGVVWWVYVDPYSLNVLESHRQDDRLMNWMSDLHGNLLSGKWGSYLVELAASWAIMLILSGMYLWWPKDTRGLAGVLYPRMGQSRRIFWRDLHAVLGIWVSAFALFLLISGLPWTQMWGTAFKELRAMGAESNSGWQVQRAPSWSAKLSERYDLSDQVLEAATNLAFAPPVVLSVSDTEQQEWKISSLHQDRPRRADAWVDREGTVLDTRNFADKSTLDRAIGIGIAAHEGQLFGWFNQLLGVLTALALIGLSVSGFVMWRRRKPKASIGAPPPLPAGSAPRTVAILMLVLACMLPMMLLSLAIIWLAEKSILSRFAASRRWLSLPEPTA